MDEGSEQTFLRRCYLNGHRAREKMLHVLSHRETNEIHAKCHFALTGVFLPDKANHSECRGWTKWTSRTAGRGAAVVGDGAGALGKSGGFSKSHTESLFDSTAPVPGVRPGELNKYVHAKNLYSIIRKSRKTGKPKCPATDEWADKAGWGHAMERCRPRAKQRGRTPKTLR